MLPQYLINGIKRDDKVFKGFTRQSCKLPRYNPNTHYLKLTNSNYYKGLIIIRHYIKLSSDYFFSVKQKAKNVDLFMMTPSISSPAGLGSDSEVIPIKFGRLKSFLTDSSQFGFEPLLMNNISKVYCYLPSMRGEDPDNRHLNQFFHCEAEIKGNINEIIKIVEAYIKFLSLTVCSLTNLIDKISLSPNGVKSILKRIINIKKFDQIEFDEAIKILEKNNKKYAINYNKNGRVITSKGETELLKILKIDLPIWIRNYDRYTVPFYQKPNSINTHKIINGDLLFPPIIKNSFGGEIVGCGERQERSANIVESLKRQKIDIMPYYWYIKLRELSNYSTTSGFGMGIERFITWCLCRNNIRDVILYPRLKNVKTYP